MRKYTAMELWLRVTLFFITCTVLVFTFQVFVLPIVESVFNNGQPYPDTLRINIKRAMNGIVGIGLVYVFLAFDRQKLKEAGFEWDKLKAQEWILVSIPITLAGLIPTVIIEYFYEIIIIDLANLLDPISLIITFIVTFLAIALGEEILFRGYLQRILETRYSFNVSAVISAFLFGLLHFLLSATGGGDTLRPMFAILVAAFVIGLSLSYTFKVTGYNLILPVAIHGFWDFFLFAFQSEFDYGTWEQVIFEIVASIVGAVIIFLLVKYYVDNYQNRTPNTA